MKKKISISQEKLIFTKEIESFFKESIFPESAIITDNTTILDFISSTDIFYSLGISDDGVNHNFEITVFDTNIKDSVSKIIKAKASNELEVMVKKVEEKYGVDITSLLNLNMPELFLQISKKRCRINHS